MLYSAVEASIKQIDYWLNTYLPKATYHKMSRWAGFAQSSIHENADKSYYPVFLGFAKSYPTAVGR